MVTDADTVSPRINWLHTDHLGTPQKATDDSAAVVWDATTTPYGELTALTASITQPLRLPGQYADAETGLHQNWWRDYDPSLGRYLQADPIGLAGGANLYGYANANPVLYVDRDGRFALPLAAPVAGLAIGTAIGYWGTYVAPDIQQWFDGINKSQTFPIGAYCPLPDTFYNESGEDPQKHGRPRDRARQDKQVRDAATETGLSGKERRELGRAVEKESRKYGESPSYEEILDIAKDIKSGDYY